MRVLVGMSGGVDSSAAALLLSQAGHSVSGITMSVWDGPDDTSITKHACYGPDEKADIEEAKAVCAKIGIDHHVFSCAQRYKELVIEYFKQEYLSGRTPNPCVMCNPLLKFGILPQMAAESGLDYDFFATGHYANVTFDSKKNRYLLLKGRDVRKDQSYFLYRLSQQQLARTIFPLGNLSKEEAREICRKGDLSVAEKSESQDFYGGDYRDLFKGKDSQGDIVDCDGKVIGYHDGVWNFTPGQRRGLNVSASEALYVVEIDAKNNRVIAGSKDKIMKKEFLVSRLNWIPFDEIPDVMHLEVKPRYGQKMLECTICKTSNDQVLVKLSLPSAHIAPGQSAVFYDGDCLIGGGIIQ